MNNEHRNITLNQLELMKHAVGLDQVGAKPKRGTYKAYRNYGDKAESLHALAVG